MFGGKFRVISYWVVESWLIIGDIYFIFFLFIRYCGFSWVYFFRLGIGFLDISVLFSLFIRRGERIRVKF